MTGIFLLVSLLHFTKGQYPYFNWEDFPSQCGSTIYDDSNYYANITTNNLAQIGQFPWLARIGLYDEKTNDMFFYCTGSLIHVNYVITAAHCGKQGRLVRLGENNLDSELDCQYGNCAPSPQDIKIKQHLFAQHCRLSNINDISLLILDEPAIFNDYVRPICIPQQPIPYYDLMNQVITVAGWSVVYSGWGTVHSSNWVKDLRNVKALVLDPRQCEATQKRPLEESELCVTNQYGLKDPCVVDSGGPIIRYVGVQKRAYLVGVASHNLLLCHVGQASATIYTDVSYFGDWIMIRINQFLKWGV